MQVDVMVPQGGSQSLDDVVDRFIESGASARPFADEIVDAVAAFSKALLHDREARRHPEITALAFKMRRAELLALQRAFDDLDPVDGMLVPRGVVFHVPPSNVDTIFAYSWQLSTLVGNRNVVRLSPNLSEVGRVICRVLNDVIADHPALAASTLMVSYGHDAEANEKLSEIADVRVVWGGDATVNTFRGIPLRPHAKELTFPDRFSYAAIKADRFLELADDAKARLVEGFFNDSYWFDQLGCSSPRVLAWAGSAAATTAAGTEFFRQLREVVSAKGFQVDTGTALSKVLFAFRSILEEPVVAQSSLGNEILVSELSDLEEFGRSHHGAGSFYQVRLEELTQLVPFIQRSDQTLSYFGFTRAELEDVAREANGKGLDRMVPIGAALDFHRYWDGYDLLQELSRVVHIDTGDRTMAPTNGEAVDRQTPPAAAEKAAS